MLLGADVGGTFTDLVWWTGTEWRVYKLPTTPAHPETALLAGIAFLGANTPEVLVVHGSTIATNAFLERTGARVTLVTTRGFADLLEIGRQNRTAIYAARATRPLPLVPAERRLEARERLDASGTVLEPLTAAEPRRVARAVAAQHPEAIAVCLLHAYVNADHERALAAALTPICPFVYLSSIVDPAYREYERMSTTVLNAYVAPLVAAYVARLRTHLAGTLRLIGSHGGRQTAAELVRPASMILSGPAGGVVGAAAVARATGERDIITLDIGGTSTDIALIQGTPTVTSEIELDGLPLRAPMLDIHTIGAGGGSIARFDRGGALVVGPASAGADPGPACYGRGGTAFTVTDAHLVLGHLVPELFLGGRMALTPDAAEAAGHALAAGRVASLIELAEGVLAVTTAAMERAVRAVSTRRGHDPADFTLCCFGGAGGLRAVALAQALGMRAVLMPRMAGTLSALGMVLADTHTTAQQSLLGDAAPLHDDMLLACLDRLATATTTELLADGHAPDMVHAHPTLEIRYHGQSYELALPWAGTLAETITAFHHEHQRRFGYGDPHTPTEVVRARVTGIATNPGFSLPEVATGGATAPHRPVTAYFAG
nr:hydantoinase/oxoprolinase family protein [Ktedonobacterales bacterium]